MIQIYDYIEFYDKKVEVKIDNEVDLIQFLDYLKLLNPNATKLAGGSVDWITEETTLKDIAGILATNKVRFYYDSSIGN